MVKLRGGNLSDALMAHLEGGVVHQDIEPAHLLHYPLYELLAVAFVANSARLGNRLPASLFNDSDSLLGIRCLVEVGDQDIGPFPREGECHRSTDTAATAGDDRDLAHQPDGAPVPLVLFREGGLGPSSRGFS